MNDKQKQRLEFAKTSMHVSRKPQIHESSTVHSTAQIGCDGFGYARDQDGSFVKVNHSGNVIIAEEVVIRAYVTVDRGTEDDTIIGKGNKIDHHVHIAHNAKIGEYNTLAAHCIIEGSCEIGSFNTFGSGVIMQRKTKLGSNCRIGSGAVITKDFPDNCIIVGNPARVLRFQ